MQTAMSYDSFGWDTEGRVRRFRCRVRVRRAGMVRVHRSPEHSRTADDHGFSQNAGTNPRAADEVEKRVDSLRSGGSRRDWAPFQAACRPSRGGVAARAAQSGRQRARDGLPIAGVRSRGCNDQTQPPGVIVTSEVLVEASRAKENAALTSRIARQAHTVRRWTPRASGSPVLAHHATSTASPQKTGGVAVAARAMSCMTNHMKETSPTQRQKPSADAIAS